MKIFEHNPYAHKEDIPDKADKKDGSQDGDDAKDLSPLKLTSSLINTSDFNKITSIDGKIAYIKQNFGEILNQRYSQDKSTKVIDQLCKKKDDENTELDLEKLMSDEDYLNEQVALACKAI